MGCTGAIAQTQNTVSNYREFDLCAIRSPEQYADIALTIGPEGGFWCKEYGTNKAAIYRAFGGILSAFDAAVCNLWRESFGCQAVSLLGEFEQDYGLPNACMTSYPADLVGRQGMVCAAIMQGSVQTLGALEHLLQTALDCPYLTLTHKYASIEDSHSTMGGWTGGMRQPLTQRAEYLGICVNGIREIAPAVFIHNTVGGHGVVTGTSATAPYGSAVGQPLQLQDPNYVALQSCPIIYHSTVGGWTGGVGQPLQVGDFAKQQLLECLMVKYLPAHIQWTIC